jgi:hypothetical protein
MPLQTSSRSSSKSRAISIPSKLPKNATAQGRDLSTLAPLRALRARTLNRAWTRRVVGEGVRSCPRAGCERFACPVRWAGSENGVMAEPLRHRQTKEAETDTRHIPTLPEAVIPEPMRSGGHSRAPERWSANPESIPRPDAALRGPPAAKQRPFCARPPRGHLTATAERTPKASSSRPCRRRTTIGESDV